MKKTILLLFVAVLILTSCEKNVLDSMAFDEAFREENRMMFYEEEHEHDIRYELIPGMESTWKYGKSGYHRVFCYYENCDFEPYIEEHIIKSYGVQQHAFCKENGLLYHEVRLYCAYCEGNHWADITMSALCQKQELKCSGDCLSEISLEELLCDMPYEILSD